MQITTALVEEIVARRHLLSHPFYRSWSEGTMSPKKLAIYALEYGSFIGRIAQLWSAAGHPEIAHEETKHADIWQKFATSLGSNVTDTPMIRQIHELNAFADAASENKATALGALLAFEFQQPSTVASKLDGLRSHYSALQADEEYFEIHLDDWEESELIIKEISLLDSEEQQQALSALITGCERLWSALTGIDDVPVAA